jgi:hypothetical protein
MFAVQTEIAQAVVTELTKFLILAKESKSTVSAIRLRVFPPLMEPCSTLSAADNIPFSVEPRLPLFGVVDGQLSIGKTVIRIDKRRPVSRGYLLRFVRRGVIHRV